MNRLSNFHNNLLWLLTSLPNHRRFQRAVKSPRSVQTRLMLDIIQNNKTTLYGKKHEFANIKNWDDFQKLPLTSYSNYNEYVDQIKKGEQNVLTSEPVKLLQPTSGTSSTSKLIPHTESIMNDFQSSLDAWMADIFLKHPKILLGSQYWSISPTTAPTTQHAGGVKIGFPDDWDYFGARRCGILKKIFAVPSVVKHISDLEAHQYATALFLLQSRNLSLISVWHPSFLTILLDFIRSNWIGLLNDIENGGIDVSLDISPDAHHRLERLSPPNKPRAKSLKKLSIDSKNLFERIWPNLQIISCWREGNVGSDIQRLRDAFPKTLIQGKGLLATEGVVTIPVGETEGQVCAVTSHVLEFLDEKGAIHPVWDLKHNDIYEVVLTTSAGLYRYRLGDRVRVVGFHFNAPSLKFLGRAGVVSDLVGEKLHLEHVEEALCDILRKNEIDGGFAIVTPSSTIDGNRHYKLLLRPPADIQPDIEGLASSLDEKLHNNYHYAHARRIGQLEKPEVTLLERDAANKFKRFMIDRGALAGTVKFPALCVIPGVEEYLTPNVTTTAPKPQTRLQYAK